MQKHTGLLAKIDNAILHILLGGFIFIVPLYPKFPIRIIDYTYIAVRAEDIYIAVFVAVFCVQLLRNKVTLNTKFLKPVIIFWIAVFASFLFNAYISGTVIYKHLGFLHSARRVEYMAVFVIASSLVTTRKQFMRYLSLVMIVLALAALYGIGQKFIGWPAVQTMNPEFAKGHLLTLTPEARVSSTFAGHYDLAAYLVLLTPIAIGMFFATSNLFYYGIITLSIFVLTLTASRISAVIAYPISTASYLIYTKKYKHFIIIAAITGISLLFSNNLIDRVLKTVQIKQIFINEQTGEVIVPQARDPKELPAGTAYIPIKRQSKEDQGLVNKYVVDELRENITKEASSARRILTASEEAALIATRQADLTAQNTIVTDISFSTRLQVEWPRAIQAFLKNPILGAGPSAITESTDNDYLRSIGEVGLFGSVSLAYVLYSLGFAMFSYAQKDSSKLRMLYYGYVFGLAGLLLNAAYIDVFEASKVAYTFWMVSGLFLGSLSDVSDERG